MEKLELGSALEMLRARFRKARGADENYPTRRWAKAAVRAVEATLCRNLLFDDFREEFEELMDRGTVEFAEVPQWAIEARMLPPFSSDGATAWAKVIRSMIREQVPDFEKLPEWETQRNTARSRCRDSRGELQNAILDDIISALRAIAPAVKLPKSGS